MLKTAACQVGLVLAARALWETQNVKDYARIPSFVSTFISALNASIANGRQLFFAKLDANKKKRINLLDRLDTSKCVHFRYLWMQLLASEEARRILADADMTGDLDNLISVGRTLYRKELINNMRKSHLKIHPGDVALATKLATEDVDESLKKALSSWFSLRAPEYAEWLEQADTRNGAQTKESLSSDDELEETAEEIPLPSPQEIESPGEDELKKLLYDQRGDE